MRVEQLMCRNIRTCTPDDPLTVPARIMWEEDCGCVPVVHANGALDRYVAGMITDRDVCMAAYTKGLPLATIRTRDVMSSDVATCRGTDAVTVALKVMETNQLHRLPVTDAHDQLIGIIALADLAREARRQEGGHAAKVTPTAIGEAVEAITVPRGGSREVAQPA